MTYPSQEQLKKISNWKLGSADNFNNLVKYVKSLWWSPSSFKVSGKRVITVKAATCGWSGNEDLIDALHANRAFWMLYWQKSERGGYHEFECRVATKKELGKIFKKTT